MHRIGEQRDGAGNQTANQLCKEDRAGDAEHNKQRSQRGIRRRRVRMRMAVRMSVATLRYAGRRVAGGRVSAIVDGASLGSGSRGRVAGGRGRAGTRRTVAVHIGTTTVLWLLLSCACGVVHTLTLGSHIPY